MAKIHRLSKFADSRGWSLNDIYSMFSPVMVQANNYQINYSILYPGIIKAWHRHKHQDDYFCVLNGMAQVGVIPRHTQQKAEKYFIGEHNPCVVHIKSGEWHGLTAVGPEPCGLLYLVTNKYSPLDPDEERAGPFDFVDKNWWLPENK